MEQVMKEEERAFRLVTCCKVWACTNGKEQEVVVADIETATAQGEIFLQAGHKMYSIDVVAVFMSEDAASGYLLGGKESIIIHREPTPSKYQRADICPGIKVGDYDYSRYNWKGKQATGSQVAVAVVCTIVAGGVPGFFFGAMTAGTWLRKEWIDPRVYISSWAVVTIFMMAGIPYLLDKAVRVGKWFAGIDQ